MTGKTFVFAYLLIRVATENVRRANQQRDQPTENRERHDVEVRQLYGLVHQFTDQAAPGFAFDQSGVSLGASATSTA